MRYFITGLIPANNEVSEEGTLLQTMIVDSGDALYFEHSGGSIFLIENGLAGIASSDPAADGFALYRNYPNV